MAGSELQNRMNRLRVEELVRIADSTPEEGFEENVVQAAQTELAARGISADEIMELQEDVNALRVERSSAAEKPLHLGMLIVFVIVGPFLMFSIFGILLFVALRTRGYNRMAREAFNASALGLIVWAVGIAVAVWLGT